MINTSAFKTSEGEAAFLAAYDAGMESWPVPYEEIEVPGRFGITHVVACGPEDAPPLVLLHGYMGTLLMWLPYIANFSEAYRVYAVDTMGQPSKSIPGEPVRDAVDYAAWVGETLDGLNLDRASFAGISFGGWLTLNFAMTAPERVRKIALLSPAASFQSHTLQFTLRGMLSGVVPTRGMMNSFMKWMGIEATPGDTATKDFLDMTWIGGSNFRMPPETRRIMPTVFTDDELRTLHMPVLLLIGEHEVLYDAAAALNRARRLMPNCEGELVPDCKHDMYISQHQIVEPRVLDFLNGN